MKEVFLDTHVVLWLYAGDVKRLSARAQQTIDKYAIGVSPAVKLELAYLHEIGRVVDPPALILSDLYRRISLTVRREDFDRVIERALSLTWTRDVFDRLIVAHAAADAATLVTKDRQIRAHYENAVW
jgi:PIN domain nuclease of toxin-antitoxin system